MHTPQHTSAASRARPYQFRRILWLDVWGESLLTRPAADNMAMANLVLFVVAAVMLVTAAVGFCPLYRVFGISTCSVESKEAPAPEPAAHA